MPYKVFATNDVLTAADMNAITADAVTASVATQEGTASTSYVDLATTTDTVSISMVNGQQAMVTVAAYGEISTPEFTYASFVASGAATVAASDANAAFLRCAVTNVGSMVQKTTWVSATSTATLTCKMKFRSSNGANTAFFSHRRISVKKF